MKKIVITLLITAGLASFSNAQGGFFENEETNTQTAASPGTDTDDGGSVGDEDEAPINDYLPLLIIAGVSIIYFNRKKMAIAK